jgi:hypothetical protein
MESGGNSGRLARGVGILSQDTVEVSFISGLSRINSYLLHQGLFSIFALVVNSAKH